MGDEIEVLSLIELLLEPLSCQRLPFIEPTLQQRDVELALAAEQIVDLIGSRPVTVCGTEAVFEYDHRLASLYRINGSLKNLELRSFHIDLDYVNVIAFRDQVIQ